MDSKIIEIEIDTSEERGLWALCEDGSLWRVGGSKWYISESEWIRVYQPSKKQGLLPDEGD